MPWSLVNTHYSRPGKPAASAHDRPSGTILEPSSPSPFLSDVIRELSKLFELGGVSAAIAYYGGRSAERGTPRRVINPNVPGAGYPYGILRASACSGVRSDHRAARIAKDHRLGQLQGDDPSMVVPKWRQRTHVG